MCALSCGRVTCSACHGHLKPTWYVGLKTLWPHSLHTRGSGIFTVSHGTTSTVMILPVATSCIMLCMHQPLAHPHNHPEDHLEAPAFCAMVTARLAGHSCSCSAAASVLAAASVKHRGQQQRHNNVASICETPLFTVIHTLPSLV